MRKILFPAMLAALVAAMVLSATQMFLVTPLILAAEVYETGAPPSTSTEDTHASTAGEEHHHAKIEHSHGDDEWAPEDGWQRTVFTAGSNLVMAAGFALVLTALYAFRAPTSWRMGMAWGAAGYAVFYAAPALGLHPELPGTEAAALEHRQGWWILTALCTAVGIGLMVEAKQLAVKVAGSIFLITPHLYGAPQPDVHSTLAPASLQTQFVVASALANALFWLVLGSVSAHAFARQTTA